mmetsp:Transcript_4643/g.19876  ORF Transcript_4643/g.19876 Transcript_4643/m.19876 type:complete len:269 (+) Transcript_4643:281-1087(+)
MFSAFSSSLLNTANSFSVPARGFRWDKWVYHPPLASRRRNRGNAIAIFHMCMSRREHSETFKSSTPGNTELILPGPPDEVSRSVKSIICVLCSGMSADWSPGSSAAISWGGLLLETLRTRSFLSSVNGPRRNESREHPSTVSSSKFLKLRTRRRKPLAASGVPVIANLRSLLANLPSKIGSTLAKVGKQPSIVSTSRFGKDAMSIAESRFRVLCEIVRRLRELSICPYLEANERVSIPEYIESDSSFGKGRYPLIPSPQTLSSFRFER